MEKSLLSQDEMKRLLRIRHSLEKIKSSLQPGFDKFKLEEIISIISGIEANHERIG